jgi:4-diphosphocytidyl-2-C-methyl-D-erythritol kinase
MSNGVSIKAPAKLNLHLEILEKRPDGFHNLRSLFQMISLYDDITIRSLKNFMGCEINGSFSCVPEKNTVYKAWKLFCRKAGTAFSVQVDIQKFIPEGSGLGGGSSDAAFFLKALNLTAGSPLTSDELMEIAAETGSDVPFFLGTECAIVEGRGELVKAAAARTDYSVFLAVPQIAVSTAEAYSWLKRTDKIPENSMKGTEIIQNYEKKAPGEWKFKNSFASVLISKYNVIDIMISTLYDFGAAYANVSGSGSSIFGIFENEMSFPALKKKLEKNGTRTWIVKPLDCVPVPVLL